MASRNETARASIRSICFGSDLWKMFFKKIAPKFKSIKRDYS